MFVAYTMIFLLAAIPFLEIALIIPLAIIGGVPAVPTMIIAFLGNLLTIVLLIIFLDKIREWRRKRKQGEQTDSKRHKHAKSLWDKYGLPGLAFIGPFFVGTHLSALLAIGFGAEKTKTLYLMTASLLSWTIVLGVASLYGFDFFIADEENLGFITRMLQR